MNEKKDLFKRERREEKKYRVDARGHRIHATIKENSFSRSFSYVRSSDWVYIYVIYGTIKQKPPSHLTCCALVRTNTKQLVPVSSVHCKLSRCNIKRKKISRDFDLAHFRLENLIRVVPAEEEIPKRCFCVILPSFVNFAFSFQVCIIQAFFSRNSIGFIFGIFELRELYSRGICWCFRNIISFRPRSFYSTIKCQFDGRGSSWNLSLSFS